MSNNTSKNIEYGIFAGCGMLMMILIVVLANIFLADKETRVSTPIENKSTEILICSAGALAEDIFGDDGAKSFRQQIRVTFADDEPSNLNYTLEARYTSVDDATKAKERFHADYNIYMSKDAESLTPTFNSSERIVRINLFANKDNLNALSGRIFFLHESEYIKFFQLDKKEVESIYENDGFSCQYTY